MKYFMKKLLIALAFVGLGTAANAQTTQIETPSKYTVATNSFWSNWYVQVGVDMTVQNPYQLNIINDGWHEGRSYGVNVAVGKWFTPGLGLRLKAQWENGAFAHAFRNTDHVLYTPDFEKGGYGAIYGDVQFNLSNLFAGYNSSRVWNIIAYPRAGVMRNFEHNQYSPVLGAGLQNTWKLSKAVGIYLDLSYNAANTRAFGYDVEHSDAQLADVLGGGPGLMHHKDALFFQPPHHRHGFPDSDGHGGFPLFAEKNMIRMIVSAAWAGVQ